MFKTSKLVLFALIVSFIGCRTVANPKARQLLDLQQRITATDITMPYVSELDIYYASDAYQLDGVSDAAFEKIHRYLQNIRYRHDLYQNWLNESQIKNIQLELILNATSYSKKTLYVGNCDSLLKQCDTYTKQSIDSCTQCLTDLRTQAITTYFVDNCNFDIVVRRTTNDEKQLTSSKGLERQKITLVSLFCLKSVSAANKAKF